MSTTATVDPKRKALGRGLESLLPSTRPSEPINASLQHAVRDLPVTEIDPNPYQTRQTIDETALGELAASIAANGIVQPIVVRPLNGRYQLIAGQRRWLASQRLGREFIPVIIKQLSNLQAMEMTIVENLQREDLNAMEQARAFERLSTEFNLTQEQISQRTGKDRSTVTNFMRLLRLPQGVQNAVETSEISFGHAKVLLMLETPELIWKAVEKIRAQALSVRQAEQLVHNMLHPEGKEQEHVAAKDTADPNVRAAQEGLQRALGVRVTIRDKNGKGKIVLEYSSLEDFDRIVEALGASTAG
jgi:ParB family chromosome partitioning protein